MSNESKMMVADMLEFLQPPYRATVEQTQAASLIKEGLPHIYELLKVSEPDAEDMIAAISLAFVDICSAQGICPACVATEIAKIFHKKIEERHEEVLNAYEESDASTKH